MNNYLYNYMNQLNQNNFYKNDNNNLFDPYNAFIRGNLFKNLYDPYKNNEPYEVRPSNEQAQLLTKMSFAFTVAEEDWDYETDTRRILRIDKLYDVSVVDVPAYEATEIYARSKEQFEEEKRKYEKLELEKKKALALISL